MGIYINGLFISIEQRFRDGQHDGYNMLVAVGAEAYRLKIPDTVFASCQIEALAMGDRVTCKVRCRAFRDNVYWDALDVAHVEDF